MAIVFDFIIAPAIVKATNPLDRRREAWYSMVMIQKNINFHRMRSSQHWVEQDDDLLFVQQCHWEHFKRDYPLSILDALRATAESAQKSGIPARLEAKSLIWILRVNRHYWWQLLKILVSLCNEEVDPVPVRRLIDLGWEYDPISPAYFSMRGDEESATAVADFTGYDVYHIEDNPNDHGKIVVKLETDDDKAKFANLYAEYQRRINDNS